MSKATFKLLVLAGLLLGLSGCMRGCTSSRPPIHPNPNMDLQPKYKAQSSSAFFYNGAAMRPQVEGTVAQGELFENTALYTGRDDAGQYVAAIPFPVNEAMVARGAERYAIYCTPCHGGAGNGRGVLYTRSGVESADLHEERLVEMADGEIFDTITNGLGLMSGYKYPIPAHDRWLIIAHVRELQGQGGS